MITNYRYQSIRFPNELVDDLISFCHKEHIEVQVAFLAVWANLWYRYTGLEQLVIGVAREGSPDKVSPLSFDFSEMHALVAQVQAVHTLLQTSLNEPQIHEPHIFHAGYLVREDTDSACRDSTDSLRHLRKEKIVTLELVRTETEWTGSLFYHEDHVEEAAISRMAGHVQQLLEGCLKQPQVPIDEISLLTEHEASQMLMEWNSASTKPAEHQSISDWFKAQVMRTPDEVAVVYGKERLTYAELDQRANQTANYLLQKGIGPEALIGVHLERSIDMMAAVLGILKAGGAYVPLDPTYATERLSYILEDAKAPVLITKESLAASFVAHEIEIVYMDRDRDAIMEAGSHTPRTSVPITGDHLAYVTYTSGSTGKPKGVAVEHGSVIALIQWAQEIYSAAEIAGVLGSTSINFDLSVFEMFVTLSMGGKLILAENALQLPHLPAAGEVTLINTVPSAIRELVRMKGIPAGVRTVNLCGEPLKRELVEQIYDVETVEKVINLYGPSEDTTYSTYCYVKRGPDLPVYIGRPIHNTQAYVLDKHLHPVPVGVAGELYLGGAGLARGYLNQEELTKEKFIPNLFSEQPNERLYRTGDLVRYTADGSLEYLSRMDHQIKIRGFRVELGDIESTLMKHPDVHEAVVVAKEFSAADLRLIAYFTTKIASQGEQEKSDYPQLAQDLRGYLQQNLPDYMIPSLFIPLEQVPLTANGKIDRKALPEPQRIPGSLAAPRNEIEERLVTIWCDVLQLECVGVENHFLDVGGQSLLAAQILVRMRTAFQTDLTQSAIFEATTIAKQAQVIAEAQKQEIMNKTSNAIVARKRVARQLQR
ncbi:amino acid adenylation domain-containing protein [Paenibacillus sp. UNC496MF]|uniref:non-ribosomal peptide synthetase n=1 Tax=Paenibacillus sp. UNC496MF TaxID=1502753 RepID=UPI0008E5CFAB|nr:amino acid adenylation domain-containing protein [Paenibacillus sp. UNC496MF]SFJ55817.1 amino acid adenylation domain-containing protein [Paenibacillus sp. UNC496MF]